MLRWRKRPPPEPVTAVYNRKSEAPQMGVDVPAPRSDLRTAAEIDNDRIMAEQLSVAAGARKAEAAQREARALWEAHRERRPRFNYSRYTY